MNTQTLKKKLKYKIPQLRLALIRERTTETFSINTPYDIYNYAEPLQYMSEEHFVSFHLSGRSHIIGFHVVSHGTPTASLVHAREVYKSAILSNAHTIIVAHNHPGGSLTPSEEDIQTTRQLIQAGQLLGVQLLDHIIVSYNGMASIREQLPNLWQEGT